MKNLAGKRAVVTGAASGIGRAIALQLAAHDVNLFLIDRQSEPLQEIARECQAHSVKVASHVCDLADVAQIDRAVAAALETFGGLDLLINNAGITYWGDTHAMTTQQWDTILGVNLLAPIRLIHGFLPTLRAQPEAHILNVSSVTGLIPKRRIAAYQTTKFALVGLGQSLRAEYGAFGLSVTTLCPGFVETNLLEAAEENGMLLRRPKSVRWFSVSPEYVARHAVRAIQRDKDIVVIPFLARLFWWMQRFSPAILDTHAYLIHRRKHLRHLKQAARQAQEQVQIPKG